MTRQLPQQFTRPAGRARTALVAVTAACLVALFVTAGSRAANPSSGTVTTANAPGSPLVFTGGPYTQPNPSNFVSLVCQPPAAPCDDFALNVDVPDGLQDAKQVRIMMKWGDPNADFDFRVYRRNPDGTAGEEARSVGSSSMPEVGLLPAVKGSYVVRIVPFNPLGQSVRMEVTVEPKVGNFTQGSGTAPRYHNYPATNGLGTGAAEPTLGVNWRTGKVMFIAGLETLRVTFNDSTRPATATWEDKSYLLTSLETLDPILYTDRDTGRTIISQLAGTNSLSALTDDDGETWMPNEGGPLTSGVDHQTVGGGPFAPPLTGGVPGVYPNAVYYCSQDAVTAFCARSDDGGLTYGPTVPMFLLTCGGIHGHVQVGPDGTVYVPNRSCGASQGVLVSTDNGITWNVRYVADADDTTSTHDSVPGSWDPAIGVGSKGTVYFGYDHADGTPHVTVSRNKGATWTDDQNVGIPFGIRSTAFPTVIAGDDDRAAFAFLGSPKAKTDTTAQWHLYVSTTYDGGKSWHTVDATPNDPVQIGPICDEGFGVGACPNGDRNLLDFMDIQVDKEGRVLVGYADGCVGCTSAGGSRSELGTIARQTCGRRLFRQYDAAADDCAAGPTPTPTPAATPTPDGSGCSYPGRKVVSDNSGDQTGAPNANQSQDIEWIRVTEDYSRATPMLAFTVKVAQLPEITPNASWTMLFSATHADNTSTTYFLSADSNTLDNPVGLSYNYGFVDVTNQNLNTSVGPADEGSMDDVAKTITIKVAMSKLRKPVAGAAGATLTGAQVDFSAGKRLSAVNGRTSLLVGALGTGLIQTIDSTGAGEYEINGQPACTGGPTPTPTATPTPTPTPTPAPTATPTPSNDPRCAGAGPEAVSDPANDQTGAPNANQSQDVRSVSISERYNAAGAGQLVFTMKVSDLTATLTPNASWRVSFNAAHADNTVTTYFVTVANNSNANPTGVSYNYGFVDTSRNNLNSTVGTADGGSMSADADTLTVTLGIDKLRKPVAGTAGQTLTGAQVPLGAGRQLGAVAGATSVLVGGLGNGLNVNVDSTSNGGYTVAGAAACPFTGPTPTPVPTPGQAAADAARFHTFTAPPGVAEDAGEPSIGVNWKSERFFSNSAGAIGNGGTVTYYGGFLPYMLRVTFDDSVSPAAAAWDQANLTLVNAPRVYGDPILFTDPKTGRTFVSQELGLTPLGSTMEFTDDDGRTFLPSTGSGAPSGIDHQTVGGGPYHAPVPTGASPLYPHGVWYCSQSVADAVCSISLDGGATFGPAVPMYTLATCGGLHGHIKIGPDGTAYIPNRGCFGTPSTLVHSDGKQSLIVSEDNGITWAIRPLPQSSWGERDPSVAVGRDNTVYFAYQNGDGRSRVAVSRDKGVTWESDTDVGALAGVKNSAFHAAVAGDGDRAAVAYYGTTTGGSDWNLPGFAGVWYLYVSVTYDRGKTWTTVNATPGDPVQRGGICGEGQCRNLLDFFGAELDKRGRVLVGYDDGCIGACVAGGPNSFTAKAAIARQSGGKPMYAEFDPPAAARPAAPAVAGSRSGSTVSLSWAAPDHGGSAITGYKVYRRDAGGVTQLATVTSTAYADTAYAAGAVYRVTAVSAAGEGPYKEYNPAGGGGGASACDGAGLLVVSDVNNDGADLDTQQNTPPDPRVNVKSLSIGEPFTGAGASKLVFTLKVSASTSGNTAPPSSQWFITWNSRNPTVDFDRMYVAMLSDAQGNVRFEYGRFGAATPLDGSAVPSPNTNQPSRLGDAAGNYDAANGTITITLPTSQAENVAAGQTMNGLNVRTFFARPEAGVRNQATASDITGDGSYTLVGNASCSGAPAGQSAANDAPASRAGLALAVLRQVLRV